MAEQSAIGWTEATWNPIQGCHKISPGCKFCYMYRDKLRYGQDPSVVVRSKEGTFNAPLKWREPKLIFTASWSDWFIEDADQWRPAMWDIIRRTPQHTYQILTKRSGRMRECLPPDWGEGWPNVWLGVSVETPMFNGRIENLRRVPALVKFISMEPLLADPGTFDLTGIDWLIVGGESGAHARESSIDWMMRAVFQAEAQGVPCFVKQLGTKPTFWNSATGRHEAYILRWDKRQGADSRDFPPQFPQEMPRAYIPPEQRTLTTLTERAERIELVGTPEQQRRMVFMRLLRQHPPEPGRRAWRHAHLGEQAYQEVAVGGGYFNPAQGDPRYRPDLEIPGFALPYAQHAQAAPTPSDRFNRRLLHDDPAPAARQPTLPELEFVIDEPVALPPTVRARPHVRAILTDEDDKL